MGTQDGCKRQRKCVKWKVVRPAGRSFRRCRMCVGLTLRPVQVLVVLPQAALLPTMRRKNLELLELWTNGVPSSSPRLQYLYFMARALFYPSFLLRPPDGARQALPHHAMSIKSVVPARVHFYLRQHVGHACSCRCASVLEFERKFPTSSICRLVSTPTPVQYWGRVGSHELVDDLLRVESGTTDLEHAKEETLTDPCNCQLR